MEELEKAKMQLQTLLTMCHVAPCRQQAYEMLTRRSTHLNAGSRYSGCGVRWSPFYFECQREATTTLV